MANENKNEIGKIAARNKQLKSAEKKLIVEITDPMYSDLEKIQRKLKEAPTLTAVVALALEIILEAEGKEIRLCDDGEVKGSYNIWK